MTEKTSVVKKLNKFIKPAIILVILIVLAFGLYTVLFSKKTSPTTAQNNTQVKSQTIALNQTFDLVTGLEDEKAGIKSPKVTFQSANLTNRVRAGNKYQYSRKGATYLLLNILIENSNTKRLNIRSKDFIRLVDNNGKKFAPSIVDKDVVLEPDAVRKDTVGFLVPDNIKEFKIQYGLAGKPTQIIELKFK